MPFETAKKSISLPRLTRKKLMLGQRERSGQVEIAVATRISLKHFSERQDSRLIFKKCMSLRCAIQDWVPSSMDALAPTSWMLWMGAWALIFSKFLKHLKLARGPAGLSAGCICEVYTRTNFLLIAESVGPKHNTIRNARNTRNSGPKHPKHSGINPKHMHIVRNTRRRGPIFFPRAGIRR
jgi:hypothetical protein